MKWVRYTLMILTAGIILAGEIIAFMAILIYPQLPSIDDLTHYTPQLPLRVYTADGTLIGEYGEERRAYVQLKDVPAKVKSAILAAEDARFYTHGAIDLTGIMRAMIKDIDSGTAAQGASTITMQLVRNFYLTRDKNFNRKFSEMLLAYKVEHSLPKDRILEIYINQIYLGQRAYGFAAAANVYFGKRLDQLSIKEAAILAGLPRAPSRFNPIASPTLAESRAGYVLERMNKLGDITDAQYREAMNEPLQVMHGRPRYKINASYVAELVRQQIYDRYGDGTYNMGYRVYTTLRDKDQAEADQAVSNGIMTYDLRHGYRGPEGYVALHGNVPERKGIALKALAAKYVVNGLEPAVVHRIEPQGITVWVADGTSIQISGKGLEFAAAAIKQNASAKIRLHLGSIIRVRRGTDGAWEIVQLPQVQAALVSVAPANGAILALCGGFDFSINQYNHVTQALRQPGSSFKPFIYSAALEKGYTPATLINDAPIVIPPSYPGGPSWAPGNYEKNFLGPITLQYALAESRNVDAVRVLLKIGVPYARDFATQFGLPIDQIPPYPSMVLGSGTFSPIQMAAAYAVFANGGYRVNPYVIAKILDGRGNVLYEAQPIIAGNNAPRVIDARNAFVMTSMLQDVIKEGTGRQAISLGRNDLAGKTGTTEDFVDAWFDGYNPSRLAVVWMGFDQPRSLGKGEVGAVAALPIWMQYMGNVLKGEADLPYAVPSGVIASKINPANGLRVAENEPGKQTYFYQENLPPMEGIALKKDVAVEDGEFGYGKQETKSAEAAAVTARPRPGHSQAENSNEYPSALDTQSSLKLKFAKEILQGGEYQAASELAKQVLSKYPGNNEAKAILDKSRTAMQR